LFEVDCGCGFSNALRPLDCEPSDEQRFYETLLAALVAHGTNLGIVSMADSAEGITVDRLQDITRTCLREEAIRAANAILVNYIRRLKISDYWGDGRNSSSDGQRFGVQGSSLLASFYPRYFGYYDRAVTVYTHLSNQFSVFNTEAISCAEREALYVLDGLLRNESKQMNRLKKKEEAPPVTTKECPKCYSIIPMKATRCPNCTSELQVT
jgi:hypothetical protein